MSPEVWMAAAEAAPLAQSGGMGDVLRALPAALARRGLGVRRFLPAYGSVGRGGFEYEDLNLAVPLGPARVPVRFLSRAEPGGWRTTLVECEELFARAGIYGPPGGAYPDNARRFTLFCRAICELARRAPHPPDVLHAHDWHAALVPLFARFTPGWRRRPATVFTIHNLGYQGRFDRSEADWLALPAGGFEEIATSDGIEDHGGINILKAGLAFSHRLTTVSPTHAREILTAEHGWGLHERLGRRARDLRGILNGADTEVWNPAADPHLPRPFSSEDLRGREEAGARLRERLGLPQSGRPVLGLVSRFVQQKGIDVVAAAAPLLLASGADLALLGAGEAAIEQSLRSLQQAHPARIGLRIGYDEPLSHLVVAGSDLLLVPSRYEPCGLVQMHALRYGTPPIVHRTGGLADTVHDEQENPGRGTGFVFSPLAPEPLASAVERALAMRAGDPQGWQALQRRGMAEDFSWDRAAGEYAGLYAELARNLPPPPRIQVVR